MNKTVWIINQYASTPDTGMGGRHFYMARELVRQGYKVYLITAGMHHLLRSPVVSDEQFKMEQTDGLNVVWVRVPKYTGPHSKQRILNWFLFSWKIRKLADVLPDKPDAILASSPSPIVSWGARVLAKKLGARLVFEVRDIWPLTLVTVGGKSVRHPLVRLMQYLEDRAYQESDRVVSNLENAVEHMVGRGMNREKFTWVPNGLSLEEVNSGAELDPDVRRLLPVNKFIVGYTGTLGLANAMEYLIEAAESLREYPEIAFVLVGEGGGKQALQELVASKGLTSFHFIGHIPKVQIQSMLGYFDACYIGWLKEDLYRFGIGANKIPEYMYSGKPVIHGYSGACDPIERYSAGLRVEAEDPQALADGILQLYNTSVTERMAMGQRGHEAAISQYEYGILANKMRSVLFD